MTFTPLYLIPVLYLFLGVYAWTGVDYSKDESVKLFQRYVRINTTTTGDLSKSYITDSQQCLLNPGKSFLQEACWPNFEIREHTYKC